MRKYLLLLLGAFVFTFAQAQNPKKLLSQATKDLGKYFEDPVANASMLSGAMTMMEQAFDNAEFAGEAKNHIKKGDFFYTLGDNQIKAILIDPNTTLVNDQAAIMAYGAYKNAYEMAQKKGDKKDALKGLQQVEGLLNNFASQQYTLQNYAGAYDNFNATLGAYELISAAGEETRLADAALMKDQKFFTAVSGYYGQKYDEVYPLYKEIHAAGTDEPAIYEGLFKMAGMNGEADAVKYLEEGREKFPDDTTILFAEINYYLEKGELDVLITKLETALEKEPNNISVINTLGSVYDNLHVKAKENGDEAKAEEYFANAKSYYERVLEQDASNFDATYSIGALYYNKAAGLTADLNALADDYSPAATKKYDAIKANMDELFDASMPYFNKAEALNPKDVNTIIALREIYARQNAFDKVDEYKNKLDAAQAGN